MRVILIAEIDEDKILSLTGYSTLEDAIKSEMGWVEESGIFLNKIIMPDQDVLKIIKEEIE
jgi:hypothetical protein